MITGLLLIWPLLAALLLLLANGEGVKKIAFIAAIVELIISVYAFSQFQINANTQFLIDIWWIKDLGISFKVGMDGISLLLVMLTTMLTPLIILTSYKHNYKNPALFYALILFMQMALIGVFVSLDGFLFYIFWELALIPIYFICLLWGGERRMTVTFKFFVYTLFGSLLMLAGFIFMYYQVAGTHSFNIEDLYKLNLSRSTQGFIFWAFFIAFAIKMPVFPFHTWQPDTYTEAPAQGTMLLSGIMLKMGVYGLIRWLLPIVPLAIKDWGMTAMILSVIGIVYASCIAIVQKDIKRLIAYSSIAHVGLISAGIFSLTTQGLQGAMIQMISHGINVVGLFFIVDIIQQRTNTREMSMLGGIRSVAPQFATLFIIVLLGTVALPLTNGFIGEFMLLSGTYQFNVWLGAIAGLTIILSAVYMLASYQKVMLGETNSLTQGFTDITGNEKVVLMTIALLIFVIGIYPKPLLDISAPAIDKILSIVHQASKPLVDPICNCPFKQ
jgi:NADH-quinone oxidoreductase subunit M